MSCGLKLWKHLDERTSIVDKTLFFLNLCSPHEVNVSELNFDGTKWWHKCDLRLLSSRYQLRVVTSGVLWKTPPNTLLIPSPLHSRKDMLTSIMFHLLLCELKMKVENLIWN